MLIEKIEIEDILEKIRNVRLLLYGDFCLDAYWILDPRGSEISVETGLKALSAGYQKYSLGGASNVAANLSALNPKQIKITGVTGDDIFGREMVSQLNSINIDTSGLVLQKDSFETYVFCKLILEGIEQPRIDFGTYNKRSKETDEKILENLRNAIPESDVIIINQQVPFSITNKEFIDELNNIINQFPKKIFIVDSRHHSAEFKNISLKTNEVEAAQLNGIEANYNDQFRREEVKSFAKGLFEKHNKPCFISRGKNGLMACDKDGIKETPGLHFTNKLDTVGAGDTALSAIASAMAAGFDSQSAIKFANFASGVTVQKLFQTGTANPDEILSLCSEHEYLIEEE
ncbi:MAG: PfkB family carbohydrate kinase [Melioribacteraceae bacterium]